MIDVCDSCCDVAYDEGIMDGVEQADVMRVIGDIGIDHVCDGKDENEPCGCAC